MEDLKLRFQRLSAFGKIIAVNAIVFVLGILLSAILKWNVLQYFSLPGDGMDALLQPWSIITYSFLHSGIWHLLFNMLLLFYLSEVLLNLLPVKKVLNIYFLGVILGGLFYILAQTLLFSGSSTLVGASAGVGALLMFTAAFLPDSQIRFFTFNIKWKYIGITMIVLDLIRISSGINVGGYISHFGGYALGYLYATQFQKGNDIGEGFERLMDLFMSLFSRKSKLKTVHRRSNKSKGFAGTSKKEFDKFNKQKQIDLILDKISKSGYDSLSDEEKKFLFEAGKD
ncbi:rhomboid family intramembrane serine protease [Winogradskyella aurantiaca]|uniref:rhomboid family intramembrane serine protease n=1 Tax=Winogradskyella aurantiaca TaxID=2219558 RepID=UPI000E1CC542|nr:rhomboid family intramembrane serine protease [Winogradskyella aurantiaca]